EFKLIDALRLILESWNDVSCETIINSFRKSIYNAKLDIKELYEQQKTVEDEEDDQCYEEINDMDIFIEKIKDGISKTEVQEGIYEEESSLSLEEFNMKNSSIFNEQTLTYYEASEHIDRLEKYFFTNNSENLEIIYQIKKVFYDNKSKRKATMLDYVVKKEK
ncbi:hypothetical protein DMUE_3709, partial [Dictyocoela muelleri]